MFFEYDEGFLRSGLQLSPIHLPLRAGVHEGPPTPFAGLPGVLRRGDLLVVNDSDTTYYLGRQTLLTSGKIPVARWRKLLFSYLSRNSKPPTVFFNLPPNRVVELGLQIEL